MTFAFNDSPLGGQEGKYIQFSRIRERLVKETLINVAIGLEKTEERDSILVTGRGDGGNFSWPF
jgi:GTP-binding protein